PSRSGQTPAAPGDYPVDHIGFTSRGVETQRRFQSWASYKLSGRIDRWLFVKTSYSWFPRYGERAADVDLTFHTPKRYRLASIGRLLESSVEGDVVTSRWTSVRPADQVCFSLGEFDEFKITDPRSPPVTVHTNSEAHRQLDRFFLALRNELGAADFFLSRFISHRD